MRCDRVDVELNDLMQRVDERGIDSSESGRSVSARRGTRGVESSEGQECLRAEGEGECGETVSEGRECEQRNSIPVYERTNRSPRDRTTDQ